MTFICHRFDYHLRLLRVEETFRRTETDTLVRTEHSKTVRCRDCGDTVTTTNISQTAIVAAPLTALNFVTERGLA